MKVLLTGSHGFIGSYLFDALGSDEVIGLDIKDGLKGDAFHARTVEKVDVVYHLAAQTSVVDSLANPALDAQINILLTLHLINQYPDTRFIYTASGGASEQDEIACPYGISKKVAGEYVKLLHKDYVICHLPNVYGIGGQGVLERFIKDDPLTIYGDGRQTRDFVHVSDIVRGLVQAMKWPKGEYFMGSGSPTRILDIAAKTTKSVHFAPERKGELQDSVVSNTTPDWKPKMTIERYLECETRNYGE